MEVCANSGAQIDQDINNVRARLLGGGDFWWSFKDGAYIAPKPREGEQGVSAFSGGGIWVGGFDQGLNMKLAAQSNRRGQSAAAEFWPGPLDESGMTDRTVCKKWDRHFRVTKDEILLHLKQIAAGNKNPDDIPSGVKRWPARGNPYFEETFGFSLPDRGLANFFDNNEDERYNPLDGDYPALYLHAPPNLATPDEMIFWVYNDEGGGAPHLLSQGAAMGMEVQATAFSFRTNDALNEMTFQHHQFINRGTDNLDSLFFAIWADPDLGCPFDDYVGCSIGPEITTPTRQMMYVYNADADDGTNCSCGGTPVYCADIPLLGLSLFNHPKDNNGNEVTMSSFMYINNGNTPPPGTQFPYNSLQYYRYMTGSWADGSPLTYGGIGKGGTKVTRYAFPDPPNDPQGWSMVTAKMPASDYQTVQSYGPFTMQPGQSHEMLFGVPFVASQQHPKPDMEPLFAADRLARVAIRRAL